MMETKLWIALCAILVIHLGSATPESNRTADLSSSKTNPVVNPVPSSTNTSLRIPDTEPGSNGTDSFNSSTSHASIITTPKPKKNVTTIASDANSTKTESITHLALSPSQRQPTTPVPSHTGTTNITQTQNISDKPTQTTAVPVISAPTSEPLKPVSTTINAITTTTKSSTSSTSSSQNSTTSQLTTNTSQSSRQSTNVQPSSRVNPHTNNASPLNADGTTTVRDSPALDPLLAGLVSAFIIAAVIITLLLFLKLRRRGNRPEFRRLQDLPMDDMEDTPLSMYSY